MNDVKTLLRPEESEYAPFYGKYVQLVGGSDVVSALKNNIGNTTELLSGISEEKSLSRYAEGKWSIKELVGHLIDTERIFAYRALRISRGDATPLAGFEQDDYIANADFDACAFSDLIREFKAVRESTVMLFENMNSKAWLRKGNASENVVSVRALAFLTAGHELHHVNILKERYLVD